MWVRSPSRNNDHHYDHFGKNKHKLWQLETILSAQNELIFTQAQDNFQRKKLSFLKVTVRKHLVFRAVWISGYSNFWISRQIFFSKNLVKTHLCALCTVLRALHLMIILLRMSGIISWPPDFVNSLLYLFSSSENVGNNVLSIKVIRPYFVISIKCTIRRGYIKARSNWIS